MIFNHVCVHVICISLHIRLKEKLPQAFMQIGWMEDDFRNLTAKFGEIWIIQSRDMIFQRFHQFCVCRPLRWDCSSLCDVTTVQLSNGTVHNFLQNFTFHENVSSLYFYTWYVRTEMNVHAVMNELDQKDYWYPRKFYNCENLCTKSMESNVMITYSGGVPHREGDIHSFA